MFKTCPRCNSNWDPSKAAAITCSNNCGIVPTKFFVKHDKNNKITIGVEAVRITMGDHTIDWWYEDNNLNCKVLLPFDSNYFVANGSMDKIWPTTLRFDIKSEQDIINLFILL